jgi:hypothetical protein
MKIPPHLNRQCHHRLRRLVQRPLNVGNRHPEHLANHTLPPPALPRTLKSANLPLALGAAVRGAQNRSQPGLIVAPLNMRTAKFIGSSHKSAKD